MYLGHSTTALRILYQIARRSIGPGLSMNPLSFTYIWCSTIPYRSESHPCSISAQNTVSASRTSGVDQAPALLPDRFERLTRVWFNRFAVLGRRPVAILAI